MVKTILRLCDIPFFLHSLDIIDLEMLNLFRNAFKDKRFVAILNTLNNIHNVSITDESLAVPLTRFKLYSVITDHDKEKLSAYKSIW